MRQKIHQYPISPGEPVSYRPSGIRPVAGYLYAISHPAFPDMLKIGRTHATPEARCEQLSGILPTPCKLEYAVKVRSVIYAERHVHGLLNHCRVNPQREWFAIGLETVKAILDGAVDAEPVRPTMEAKAAALEAITHRTAVR